MSIPLSRCDQYRDTLVLWVEWWNNVGRRDYRGHILPPLMAASEALACLACAGETSGVDRCAACGRPIEATL